VPIKAIISFAHSRIFGSGSPSSSGLTGLSQRRGRIMSSETSVGCLVVTQSEHTLIGKIEKYFVVCECDVRSMPSSSLFTKRFLDLQPSPMLSAAPNPSPEPLLHREYPSVWKRPRSFDNTYIHCSTICRLPKARKRFLIGSQEGVLSSASTSPRTGFGFLCRPYRYD
jgi:hypothetical protein